MSLCLYVSVCVFVCFPIVSMVIVRLFFATLVVHCSVLTPDSLPCSLLFLAAAGFRDEGSGLPL